MEQGLNNNAIKAYNLGLVLRHVITEPSITRIDLASRTGLTKMAVTNVVSELINEGILSERKNEMEGKKGRPSISLDLSASAPKVVGVSLNADSATAALLSLRGEVLKSASYPYGEDAHDAPFHAIDDILRASINEKILGISFICEGSLDRKSNRLVIHPNPSLVDWDFVAEAKKRYQLPIFTEEKQEAIGAFEKELGLAKDSSDFVYIQISEDISSAIYVNNMPLKNRLGLTPNLGHLSIDYNGLSCPCGNRGCLQSYISTEAMEKKLRDITKLKADFKGFCEIQSKKNDSRIDWAFKDMMDKLCFALISLSNLINPQLVLIGGKGRSIPDRYLAKLEKGLQGKRIHEEAKVKVLKSTLEDSDATVTAISPVLSELFRGNLHLK